MNEPVAPHPEANARQGKAPDAPAPDSGGPVMSDTPTSGARGLAIVLGAMFGVIGLLWLVAALVAPR